jgi:hypothetical protein
MVKHCKLYDISIEIAAFIIGVVGPVAGGLTFGIVLYLLLTGGAR